MLGDLPPSLRATLAWRDGGGVTLALLTLYLPGLYYDVVEPTPSAVTVPYPAVDGVASLRATQRVPRRSSTSGYSTTMLTVEVSIDGAYPGGALLQWYFAEMP